MSVIVKGNSGGNISKNINRLKILTSDLKYEIFEDKTEIYGSCNVELLSDTDLNSVEQITDGYIIHGDNGIYNVTGDYFTIIHNKNILYIKLNVTKIKSYAGYSKLGESYNSKFFCYYDNSLYHYENYYNDINIYKYDMHLDTNTLLYSTRTTIIDSTIEYNYTDMNNINNLFCIYGYNGNIPSGSTTSNMLLFNGETNTITVVKTPDYLYSFSGINTIKDKMYFTGRVKNGIYVFNGNIFTTILPDFNKNLHITCGEKYLYYQDKIDKLCVGKIDVDTGEIISVGKPIEDYYNLYRRVSDEKYMSSFIRFEYMCAINDDYMFILHSDNGDYYFYSIDIESNLAYRYYTDNYLENSIASYHKMIYDRYNNRILSLGPALPDSSSRQTVLYILTPHKAYLKKGMVLYNGKIIESDGLCDIPFWVSDMIEIEY